MTKTPEAITGPVGETAEGTLERAIAALTRRFASASDDEIAALVAERRAMREELDEVRRAGAMNVVSLGRGKGTR